MKNDLRKRLFLALLPLFFCVPCTPAGQAEGGLKIGIIGDSTVSIHPPGKSYKRGWGQMLPEFLASNVIELNEAKGGASTRSFPAERWKAILDFKPDYLLIQFGHNDANKKDLLKYADASTDYKVNLRRYIDEARRHGIIPVLVTPVRRRVFRKSGKMSTGLDAYSDAMKVLANELEVRVIDLHSLSEALYVRLGEKGSDAFTVNKLDQPDLPNPSGDRTHLTETGAREMARLVAEQLYSVDERLVR